MPDGLVVMHICDNPRCVRPSHLRVGTQAENIQDSIDKGRHSSVTSRRKLTDAQVREIRALARYGLQHNVIAKQFGVARNTVCDIVNRVTRTKVV